MTEQQQVPPTTDEQLRLRLDAVTKFAEQVQQAEDANDQGSVGIAQDLAWLYEHASWQKEVHRPKAKPKPTRGRPVDPRSRNQFIGWVTRRTNLSPSYAKRLLKAGEWLAINGDQVTLNLSGERALRPLYEMERPNFPKAKVVEVYANVQELAGNGPVTSEHTRRAVAAYRPKTDALAPEVRLERQITELIKKLKKIDGAEKQLAKIAKQLQPPTPRKNQSLASVPEAAVAS